MALQAQAQRLPFPFLLGNVHEDAVEQGGPVLRRAELPLVQHPAERTVPAHHPVFQIDRRPPGQLLGYHCLNSGEIRRVDHAGEFAAEPLFNVRPGIAEQAGQAAVHVQYGEFLVVAAALHPARNVFGQGLQLPVAFPQGAGGLSDKLPQRRVVPADPFAAGGLFPAGGRRPVLREMEVRYLQPLRPADANGGQAAGRVRHGGVQAHGAKGAPHQARVLGQRRRIILLVG